MKGMKKKIVIDAGNTRIKIATFINNQLTNVLPLSWEEENLHEKLREFVEFKSIFCSVADDKKNETLIDLLQPDLVFDYSTEVPVDLSNYKTISTLGRDRIANVTAAKKFSKSCNALIIDCGTCIKFDLVAEGKYLGGSISPGVQMRLTALHQFTGKLPLISFSQKNLTQNPLIGTSTKSSILSGVMNGVQHEINGFIEDYNRNFENLTIFLTGGDAKLFDLHNKNTIFVDSYMTLKGLFLILRHNGY